MYSLQPTETISSCIAKEEEPLNRENTCHNWQGTNQNLQVDHI